MIRALILAAGLALAATAAQADPCEAPLPKPGTVFAGPVSYVGDGDGLCVTGPAGQIEVRLADWYAPEINTPEGRRAAEVLRSIVMGRTVKCRAMHRSYDRVVAQCALDGTDIGRIMRSRGVVEGGRGWPAKSR